jgi:hypothetical protein
MNAYEECRRAADLGIKRSADGAKAWHPFMRLCVTAAAVAHAYVTMDEVLDEAATFIDIDADPPLFNLMAFGSMMQGMQKQGVLRKQQGVFRPSRRKSQHRPRQVYQSLIYSPGAIATNGGIQPLLIDNAAMVAAERQPIVLLDTMSDT